MKLEGAVVAVTGGGGGLGSAVCRAARERGAVEVIVIDLDGAAADAVAKEVGGHPFAAGGVVTTLTEQVGRSTSSCRTRMPVVPSIRSGATTAGDAAGGSRDVERLRGPSAPPGHAAPGTRAPVVHRVVQRPHDEPDQHGVRDDEGRTACGHRMAGHVLRGPGDRSHLLLPQGHASADARAGRGARCLRAQRPDRCGDPGRGARIKLDAVEADWFMAITYPPVVEEFRLKGAYYKVGVASARRLHREFAPSIGRPPA